MSLRFLALVASCVLLCGGLMLYKIEVFGYGIDLDSKDDRWNVQVTIHAEAVTDRARLSLALPDASGQIYDEHFSSPGATLSIKSVPSGRTAAFTADRGPVSVVYRLSVKKAPALPGSDRAGPSDTGATDAVPSDDPVLAAHALTLVGASTDEVDRVRRLYDFVLDEVAPADAPADSVLEAFAAHKGGPTARVRLFVALVRSLRIPARVVHAVELVESSELSLQIRAEVLLGGHWTEIDPVHGRFGADADRGFVLGRCDGELASGAGLRDISVFVAATRQGASELDLFERRTHHRESLVDWLSFYALPPRSQLVFRVLLLVPLGALIVSVFRNLVGIETFGTFIPILIALALRETKPLAGLLMLAIVVGAGLAGRQVLAKLRLLIVPRLSLLLTFVIAVMAFVALLAARLDASDGLSVALLPMVIMTMTIERLSVMLAEEGLGPALRAMAGTILVAGAGYALIQVETLQRAFFAFPELNLLVVAALLLLGRYTGYRLSERLRFRALIR